MGRKIPINAPIHQGWNILWYRSLNDWSQDDLAKESGFSQREISDFEKTSIIPSDILQKFADAFNTDIRYLRDVASYSSVRTTYVFDNDYPQVNGDFATQTVHPLDAVTKMHETTTANLIEAHNRYTYSLEKQIEELKAELKELRGK
ncbi:MAG: helix-turn-helix domain-containing protein [Tannerellaceae bacterium]|nr:helix-turn-helix domain-containing protein [Tannerellaceae bacterium]